MGADKVDIWLYFLLPRRGEVMWSYRARKRTDKGEVWYDVVEYYTDPRGWTRNGIAPGGETKEELILELEMILKDVKAHRVLIDKEQP